MTTTNVETRYKVRWASVTVRGEGGSQSIFYQDDIVKPWTCATSNAINSTTRAGHDDHATDAEIMRLLELGAIEAA